MTDTGGARKLCTDRGDRTDIHLHGKIEYCPMSHIMEVGHITSRRGRRSSYSAAGAAARAKRKVATDPPLRNFLSALVMMAIRSGQVEELSEVRGEGGWLLFGGRVENMGVSSKPQ